MAWERFVNYDGNFFFFFFYSNKRFRNLKTGIALNERVTCVKRKRRFCNSSLIFSGGSSIFFIFFWVTFYHNRDKIVRYRWYATQRKDNALKINNRWLLLNTSIIPCIGRSRGCGWKGCRWSARGRSQRLICWSVAPPIRKVFEMSLYRRQPRWQAPWRSAPRACSCTEQIKSWTG